MENKEKRTKVVTIALMVIYLVILTWIILLKMQFSIKDIGRFRSLNLIPFSESVIINGRMDFSEVYMNVIIFIPFGIYISMLKSNTSFLQKVLPIAVASLLFEVLQFVLSLGASDITDFLGNTFGGVLGIIFYTMLCRVIKNNLKINKIINIVACIGTICTIMLLLLLIIIIN